MGPGPDIDILIIKILLKIIVTTIKFEKQIPILNSYLCTNTEPP